MTALAERPGPQPAELRVTLIGLRLAISRRDGSAGYQVLLEPFVARKLAADLIDAASQAERAAAPVLEELEALITSASESPDFGKWRGSRQTPKNARTRAATAEDDAEIQEILRDEIVVEQLTGNVTRTADERLWFGSSAKSDGREKAWFPEMSPLVTKPETARKQANSGFMPTGINAGNAPHSGNSANVTPGNNPQISPDQATSAFMGTPHNPGIRDA